MESYWKQTGNVKWIMVFNLLKGVFDRQTVRMALFVCLLGAGQTALTAQTFVAVNDSVVTGPMRKIKINVTHNDTIPCDAYSLQILTTVDAATQGQVRRLSNDAIEFIPCAKCGNTQVVIAYRLACGTTTATANVVVNVAQYNDPLNIIRRDEECFDVVKKGNTIASALKYVAGKGSKKRLLDGFSLPLVGDINNDGKPEIVALGLSSGGVGDLLGGLAAEARYIVIFNGQTGEQIGYWDLGAFKLRWEPRHNSISKLAIADLDTDGLGEIVLTSTNGNIYCLKPKYDSQGKPSSFTTVWSHTSGNNRFKYPITSTAATSFGAPVPYIADINADGTPEVIVYNKLYDGRTGAPVCTLETLNRFDYTTAQNTNSNIHRDYAFVGRRPGAEWDEDAVPCMSIADINNDGILDIVAGSKVYLMKNSNGTPAVDKIMYGPQTVVAQCGTGTSTVTTRVNDGFTSVADIDGNGLLDVVVMAPAEDNLDEDARLLLYVWEPMASPNSTLSSPAPVKAALYLRAKANTGTVSYPFIGDINGRYDNFAGNKKLPEICFVMGTLYTSHSNTSKIAPHPLSRKLTTDASTGIINNSGFGVANTSSKKGHVLAFTWHADAATPLEKRLKLSWVMEHVDESGCTGITMFDFDNDGVKELCYRDELTLRIISPAGNAAAQEDYLDVGYLKNNSPGPVVRLFQEGVRSYTGYEPTVIADVNMDGSADLVTIACDSVFNTANNKSVTNSGGYIYVFEHKSGTPKWAPCPPVWNQAIYSPLLIHEDLTVPVKPQSMLTKYLVGQDTVQPFNGHWIQQPIVKEDADFVPIARKPDAAITHIAVKVESASRTTVTLTIYNGGTASISAAAPISFHNGGTTGAALSATNFIGVQDVGVDIFPKETVKKDYVLTGNFNNCLIWARILANNMTFPALNYDDCDISSNLMGGASCPFHNYTADAARAELCSGNDSIRIVARTASTALNPVFQWYRNDMKLTGATDSVHYAKATGTYKCYVAENVCRGYSSETVIVRYSPTAQDDYVSTFINQTIPVNVLDNDRNALICHPVIDLPVHPRHGSARVSGDSVVYTPNVNFKGVDSLTYSISQNFATTLAQVYILVHAPLANDYTACAGAEAQAGFRHIPQVVYQWYPTENSNIRIPSSSDTTINTVKSASPASDQFWAEPIYRGMTTFPRIHVSIAASDNCGNTVPTGCAATGTLLFKEDFGGNRASDRVKQDVPLSRVQGLTFHNWNDLHSFPDNTYAVLKTNRGVNWGNWYGVASDHTVPNNPAYGYFMMVNAADRPAQLYEYKTDRLCEGANLYLSAWLASLCINPKANKASLLFSVEDTLGNTIARYCTGNLPDSENAQWKNYGFPFTVPYGHTAVIVKIYSNTVGRDGNDFILDDIELRLCVPPVACARLATGDTVVCAGVPVSFSGSYIDNNTFGQNLISRWERNSAGTPFEASSWTTIQGTETTSNTGTISSSCLIAAAAAGDTGYYRMVVADAANINSPNCCAASNIIRLRVVQAHVPPDVRIFVCPSPNMQINLSSYIDTMSFAHSILWQPASAAPPFVAGTANTTGTLEAGSWTHPLTYTYLLKMTAGVLGSYQSKVYVHTVGSYHKSITVHICKDLDESKTVQLNHILGLEAAGGTWNYPNDAASVFRNNITEINTGNLAGAKIFDAQAAYYQADASYNYDATRKRFVFEYSNGQTVKKTVTLIVF
ncbi:MAG: hypothetical protein LBD59_10775 [Prevotellaceae bacterium]|jgi:hypothetical protein|nr:hypothetical protein [Prevotellaceae bacterium]